jgi:putative endonuclease
VDSANTLAAATAIAATRRNYDHGLGPNRRGLNQAGALHHGVGMANPKRTVYVLKSVHDPARYYTGVTSDVSARLAAHNAGRCPHTVDARPWQVDVIVRFADERRALKSEQYLKSGSGRAFAKRHLR